MLHVKCLNAFWKFGSQIKWNVEFCWRLNKIIFMFRTCSKVYEKQWNHKTLLSMFALEMNTLYKTPLKRMPHKIFILILSSQTPKLWANLPRLPFNSCPFSHRNVYFHANYNLTDIKCSTVMRWKFMNLRPGRVIHFHQNDLLAWIYFHWKHHSKHACVFICNYHWLTDGVYWKTYTTKIRWKNFDFQRKIQ